MKLDFDTSTVTIAGRRFPAVAAICPPVDDDDPGTDRDRMLGGHGGPGTTNMPVSDQVYIPCENGAFVAIEAVDGKPGYAITLHSRACQQTPWDDSHIWVPYFVGIDRAELIVQERLLDLTCPWRWEGAEPEWTVELIDRVNRMPFTQPPGPEVRLIPIAEAFADR